jgi:hypothetical protein
MPNQKPPARVALAVQAGDEVIFFNLPETPLGPCAALVQATDVEKGTVDLLFGAPKGTPPKAPGGLSTARGVRPIHAFLSSDGSGMTRIEPHLLPPPGGFMRHQGFLLPALIKNTPHVGRLVFVGGTGPGLRPGLVAAIYEAGVADIWTSKARGEAPALVQRMQAGSSAGARFEAGHLVGFEASAPFYFVVEDLFSS